jgi:hypothetical protein
MLQYSRELSRDWRWCVVLLSICFGLGCGPRVNYQALGSGFYWYNKESPLAHAPNTHLGVILDGNRTDIAECVLNFASPQKPDLLVYGACEMKGRKEGLYVYKKKLGSNLIAPGVVVELRNTKDGVEYRMAIGDPKKLSWDAVEREAK